MKKVIPFICAATIISSPFSAYVQAAEGDTPVVEQPSGENTTQEETAPGLEQVDKLTLDDVVKRGTENNKNLTLLALNLAATNQQLLDTEFNLGDVKWDIRDLEDTLDDLKDERKDLKDVNSKIYNGQQRIAIQDSLDALDDQIQALELAIKQLKSGELQLQLQQEEAKEGVRLMLTSSYASILMLQEQIEFTEKAVKSATADVKKAQRMYDYGTGSKEAIRKAQVNEKSNKKKQEKLQKQYNHDVANLSFNIGVAFNPNVTIEPIVYTASESKKPESFTSLIENSFKVKNAQQSYETAILTYEDTLREFEEDDNVGAEVSTYEVEQYKLKMQAAEETVVKTKDDVETALEKMYYNADTSYFDYQEALRNAEDMKQDLRVLKVRYKYGYISKRDYESAKIQLDQANLNTYLANMQNFLANESIKASEKGYIQ